MEARNAAGRRVSLLNDSAPSQTISRHHPTRPHPQPLGYQHSALARQYPSPRSSASSPDETPELQRSSSYDSQGSNDPTSPMTPAADYLYPHGRTSIFSGDVPPRAKRPAYMDSSRSTSYEDDSAATAVRPAKRYPCRYRDTHGCDKTFTTSGHASRHSKIHTAEKAVQCTFPGCQKKFTRADNMKQHLETHYKDKSRSSGAARAHRHSAMGRSRSSTNVSSISNSSASASHDAMQWESDAYVTSPASPNGWEGRGFNLPIISRPVTGRAPNSGLDALAMAIACQEDGVRV